MAFVFISYSPENNQEKDQLLTYSNEDENETICRQAHFVDIPCFVCWVGSDSGGSPGQGGNRVGYSPTVDRCHIPPGHGGANRYCYGQAGSGAGNTTGYSYIQAIPNPRG
jgi:hypothetical protein